MCLVVLEDWCQVDVRVGVDVPADPLADTGVQVRQLLQVVVAVGGATWGKGGRGGSGAEAQVGFSLQDASERIWCCQVEGSCMEEMAYAQEVRVKT